jgi:hypothetical protein
MLRYEITQLPEITSSDRSHDCTAGGRQSLCCEQKYNRVTGKTMFRCKDAKMQRRNVSKTKSSDHGTDNDPNMIGPTAPHGTAACTGLESDMVASYHL